ncbi:MAG TPA: inorganic diphosphatase [Polyangiaceae bacterium]
MPNLIKLPSWDERGRLRVVVETPRGSAFKVRYDPETRAFSFQRPLSGQRYPHDWGFIPGTLGEDGDPLDALVLHEHATWPGIVVLGEPIAVLKIRDKKPGQPERQNDRVIVLPSAEQSGAASSVLSAEKRRELTAFFQAAGEQTKEIHILGWGDSDEARAVIARAGAP